MTTNDHEIREREEAVRELRETLALIGAERRRGTGDTGDRRSRPDRPADPAELARLRRLLQHEQRSLEELRRTRMRPSWHPRPDGDYRGQLDRIVARALARRGQQD